VFNGKRDTALVTRQLYLRSIFLGYASKIHPWAYALQTKSLSSPRTLKPPCITMLSNPYFALIVASMLQQRELKHFVLPVEEFVINRDVCAYFCSFNRDLMQRRGASLGAEFKAKGVHVALGEYSRFHTISTLR
jgi:hypothetical protein